MKPFWIFVVYCASVARANYPCLCNYNVEQFVYEKMSNSSQNLGSLYEFDCKEKLLNTTVNPGWTAVAFENKVGYVYSGDPDSRIENVECQGSPLDSDKVTTPTPKPLTTTDAIIISTTTTPSTTRQSTTTSSTTMQATTTPSTTRQSITKPSTTRQSTTTSSTTTQSTTKPSTAIPSTHHSIVSGRTALCPAALQSHIASESGILAQYDNSCYEIVPHFHSWQHAEGDCKRKGGHLAHINNPGEQQFIYSFLSTHYNHAVWIGLHDLNQEGHFEWVSGDAVNFTKWLPGRSQFLHYTEDCVFLDPHNNGYWDDDDCGQGFLSLTRYPYVCQYGIHPTTISTGTVNSHVDGNAHLCPMSVQHYASVHHGILGHYGQSCYELLPRNKVKWSHGESLCKQQGGHLAHINNKDEQNFVQSFMLEHSPHHAVWIGLNDVAREKHFVWTSGNPVTYTNWINGHSGTGFSHYSEDCTLFIPYQHGQWDDVPCGTSFLIADVGETHPLLCRFPTSSGSASVLVG